jgi:Do/DeqQ family serine protease
MKPLRFRLTWLVGSIAAIGLAVAGFSIFSVTTARGQGHVPDISSQTPSTITAAAPVSPITGVATLAPVIKPVMPAVVSVSVKGHVTQSLRGPFDDPLFRRFFNIPDEPQQREFEHAGSGVIVDAAHGYILTNNHVIDDAESISVKLSDDREFDAKLVGRDPETDIAVIQIPHDSLTAAPLGESDNLQVGDFVIAIGNPFGLGHTVTSGIVSAVGRTGLGIEGYEDFIQTDASINPGNSGGALLDLRGRLVGINTAIVGPSGGNVGIGFAIPISMARAVMDQLIANGKVERGELGILVQDLTPDVAKAMGVKVTHGAVIAQVMKNSAAEKADLKAGDVIDAVDGEAVHSGADLRNKVGLKDVGQTVRLSVLRNGKNLTKEVKLTSKSVGRIEGATLDERLDGATFGSVREGGPAGVAVVEVSRTSRAYSAGLRSGDVITSVNRQPIESVGEFETAVQAAKDVLVFNVQRGDAVLFIVIG